MLVVAPASFLPSQFIPGKKSVWRVSAIVGWTSFWSVKEVEFHADSNCGLGPAAASSAQRTIKNPDLLQGIIPYGSTYVTSSNWADGAEAFDSSLDSAWDSKPCDGSDPEMEVVHFRNIAGFRVQGCPMYIGLSYLNATEVNCVRFLQDALEKRSAEQATVEVWQGSYWETVWDFPGVARGKWTRFPHDIPPPVPPPTYFPFVAFVIGLILGTVVLCCAGFGAAHVHDRRRRKIYEEQYKLGQRVEMDLFKKKAATLGWNVPDAIANEPGLEVGGGAWGVPLNNRKLLLPIQDRIEYENRLIQLRGLGIGAEVDEGLRAGMLEDLGKYGKRVLFWEDWKNL